MIGFYRAWQESEQRATCSSICSWWRQRAPTLFGIASDASNRASRLMGLRDVQAGDKYSISAAKDAAKDAANAAASLGSSMMSSGKNARLLEPWEEHDGARGSRGAHGPYAQ